MGFFLVVYNFKLKKASVLSLMSTLTYCLLIFLTSVLKVINKLNAFRKRLNLNTETNLEKEMILSPLII